MWPSHSESYFRKRPARMRSTGYRPVRSRKIPMSHPRRPAAALVALALAAPASALAEPGAIKGQDVMGDRSRCANDAPDPGGNSTAMNRDRPVRTPDRATIPAATRTKYPMYRAAVGQRPRREHDACERKPASRKYHARTMTSSLMPCPRESGGPQGREPHIGRPEAADSNAA